MGLFVGSHAYFFLNFCFRSGWGIHEGFSRVMTRSPGSGKEVLIVQKPEVFQKCYNLPKVQSLKNQLVRELQTVVGYKEDLRHTLLVTR